MNTDATPSQLLENSRGRVLLWLALGLSLGGLALVAMQFQLGFLIAPWYLPILGTVGAFLALYAATRRPTVPRVVLLILLLAIAGLEWFGLTEAMKLPDYEGPVVVGRPLPPFSASLVDGRSFTLNDLLAEQDTVLVFFRGRW